MVTPELYNWLAWLAFILGVVGLLVEILVLPGFGVAGLAGIIAIGWGVLLLSVDLTQATAALVISLVLTVGVFIGGLKLFTRWGLWQRMTLTDRQKKDSGFVAPRADLSAYLGKTGTAVTPLRPAGSVDIDGQRLDVVTEGDYIKSGAEVVVYKVEGTRVVVRLFLPPK